jgi:hypothetical protein
VLGLVLGVTQLRKPRPFDSPSGLAQVKPFRLSARIPYSGPMRWHYISGVVFGVFTLTFAFSGLLSMEPWEWTNAEGLELPRNVLSGGPVDLTRFAAHDAAAWNGVLGGVPAKEVEFARMLDEPYYIVRRGSVARDESDRERLHQPYPIRHARIEDHRQLVSATTFTTRAGLFDQEAIVSRIKAAAPGARIVETQPLTEYDTYYYSRNKQIPLPALRLKFDDPAQTWVYVDPSISEVVTAINRWQRVERWAYHGLHSLDLPYLYNSRPSWDIVMIVLCLGGLTSSVLGLTLGARRVRRAARGLAAAPQKEGLRAKA